MKKRKKTEKTKGMGAVQRRFSLLMYFFVFAAFFYPWMMIGGKRYHMFSFATLWRREGTRGVLARAGVPYDAAYGGGFRVFLTLFLVYGILSVFYVAAVLARRKWNINYAVLVVCVVIMFTCREEYLCTPGKICENELEAALFPAVFLMGSFFECVGRKMMEIWDESLREMFAYQEKVRQEKAERKRRLAFPGSYSKLFYEAVWKNFRKNLKNYAMLFVCNALVFLVVFAGFGLQQVIRAGDVSLQLGVPAGAGKILLGSLLELGAVGLFMLVLLLLYYLKRRIPEYGIFSTLGIRRRTMYFCMGAELILGGGISLFLGGIFGGVLVEILKHRLGKAQDWFSPWIILMSVGVIALFYVTTFFVTHDLFVGLCMGSSTDLGAVGEKMPKKFHIFFIAGGILFSAGALREYSFNANYEYIDLVIAAFLGIYLAMRHGMAKFIKAQRKNGGYLNRIFKQHSFYHKPKSAAGYMLGLCVLQSCMLGLVSVQFFSAFLVGNGEGLSPYGLVCLADESGADGEFIKRLSETEGMEVMTFPMVRVIGNRAEQPGRFDTAKVYSQNIGISESAYHELKKRQDSGYRKKALGFDADGAGIYIVHQQDKSTKARPIDYWTGEYYVGSVYSYSAGFDEWGDNELAEPFRTAGEETSALIGIMCQGERENIVVFSDAYFEKARQEAMELDYPGPTKLILANGKEDAFASLEPELKAFKERHRKDEKYDARVKSYYRKEDAQKRFRAELDMKRVMAEFLLPIFFLACVLLIKIKLMTERRANERRTEFLSCMGMRKKERCGILRSEMRIYYIVTLLISAAVSAALIWATFRARFYEPADITFMLKRIIPFALCEYAELGLVMAFLTECEVRRIERKL